MKPRITRKEKVLYDISARIENLEKVILSILLRLEKIEEEKKVSKE